MANLSVTTAWNETAAFVQREARLLFPIAFMLIALPGGLLQMFLPEPTTVPVEQAGTILLLIPFWIVAVILAMIGTIAISFLALRPGASVGEALQVGARRFIMLLLASFLIGLAALAVMVPVIILLVISGSAMGSGGLQGMTGPIILVGLVLLAAAIAVWARLMLMTPVTAVENAGPIGIIARSWELTGGLFWKLIGLILLMLVVFIIISMVVGIIAGIVVVLVAGQPAPGNFAAFLVMLVGALLNMVVTVYLTVLVSRIYAQLTGSGREQVFT